MNDKQLRQLFSKAKDSITLDAHKKAGFQRILEFVVESQPVVDQRSWFTRFAYVLTGLAIVLTSGVGATFAAQRSVPGDLLYSAKVGALEPLERRLAFTQEAQEQVALNQLERRLKEATTLAERGDIEPYDEELALLASQHLAAMKETPSVRADRVSLITKRYLAKIEESGGIKLALVATGPGDSAPLATLSATVIEATAREAQVEAIRDADAIVVLDKDNSPNTKPVADAVASRIAAAKRLALAANREIERGQFRAALELSGASTRASVEARALAVAANKEEKDPVVSEENATTTTSTVDVVVPDVVADDKVSR